MPKLYLWPCLGVVWCKKKSFLDFNFFTAILFYKFVRFPSQATSHEGDIYQNTLCCGSFEGFATSELVPFLAVVSLLLCLPNTIGRHNKRDKSRVTCKTNILIMDESYWLKCAELRFLSFWQAPWSVMHTLVGNIF